MATGAPAFEGATTGLVMEHVLTREPVAASARNRTCPPPLEAIITKSLEKDRELRYQSAREMLVDLKRLRGGSSSRSRESSPARRDPRSGRRAWLVAAAAVGLLALAGWFTLRNGGFSDFSSAPVTIELGQIRQITSLPGLETQPALSPDGQMVAYVRQAGGNRDIWVKRVSGGAAVQTTDDPADDMEPSWSPDGSTIAFRSSRSGGGIFTVAPLGGAVTRVSTFGFSPRWSLDGTKLLIQRLASSNIPNEVYRVDLPSGQPQRVLGADVTSSEGSWSYGADWSPDGRHMVAVLGSMTSGQGLFVGAEYQS